MSTEIQNDKQTDLKLEKINSIKGVENEVSCHVDL